MHALMRRWAKQMWLENSLSIAKILNQDGVMHSLERLLHTLNRESIKIVKDVLKLLLEIIKMIICKILMKCYILKQCAIRG